MVELGYVSDTKYLDKVKEQIAQHQTLFHMLQTEGYEVNFLPIVLGNLGQRRHNLQMRRQSSNPPQNTT